MFATDMEVSDTPRRVGARSLHFYDFKSKRHILFKPENGLGALFSAMGNQNRSQDIVEVDFFDSKGLVVTHKGYDLWARAYCDLVSEKLLQIEVLLIDQTKSENSITNPVFKETNSTYFDKRGNVYMPQKEIDEINGVTK